MAEVWGGSLWGQGTAGGGCGGCSPFGTWTTREGFMHAVSLGWAGWNDKVSLRRGRGCRNTVWGEAPRPWGWAQPSLTQRLSSIFN